MQLIFPLVEDTIKVFHRCQTVCALFFDREQKKTAGLKFSRRFCQNLKKKSDRQNAYVSSQNSDVIYVEVCLQKALM